MLRIYFVDFHPADLADVMKAGCPVTHPRIQYANKILKGKYGAKIKKEQGCGYRGLFYIEFSNDEDMVAFKLAHGF